MRVCVVHFPFASYSYTQISPFVNEKVSLWNSNGRAETCRDRFVAQPVRSKKPQNAVSARIQWLRVIPEEWLRIAQPFKVGFGVRHGPSPAAKAESDALHLTERDFSRPFGTVTFRGRPYPRLKPWAILASSLRDGN